MFECTEESFGHDNRTTSKEEESTTGSSIIANGKGRWLSAIPGELKEARCGKS
jgi:hypothetical protein